MSYVDEVLEVVQKKNADQPEFLQAVTEVLESLRPVIDANEDLYKKNAILERITEPDRQIMFRVQSTMGRRQWTGSSKQRIPCAV